MVHHTNGRQEPLSTWIFQLLATLTANLCSLAQGCSIGWASPSIPILLADDSPLASGPLSVDEAAWVISILPIASIVGTIMFGTLANYVGSKRSLLGCALPAIISWVLTLAATQPWHLYLARIAAGLTGGGIFLCITMFVAEIASDNVRGRLIATMQFFFNLGIMLGFVAGTVLDYQTVPVVIAVVPIVFLCTFYWFPSTPQYLVKVNQLEKAEASLRFYRNCRDQGSEQAELKAELLKFATIAKQNAEMPPVRLSDFLNREAIRGLMIGPTLLATAQFSGTFMMSNYAATIFRESGSSIDPNMSAIVMGSIQVLGTICASVLIDRIGRKMLLLISCAGSAVALVVTGIYSYGSEHGHDMNAWNLLPIFSLSAFIFISAIGLTPVPYVLVTEVLPQNIRSIGATIGVCSVSVFAFIMLRIFPILLDAMGMYWCMWTFALVSTFGFFFTLFVVRETNGINLDQVMTENTKTEA